MDSELVTMRGIAKDFGPVRVLFDVDLSLRQGEVHALLGENGAGKSTLMKILAGYHRPSEGRITLQGEPVSFAGSGEAEAAGIVLIHQELNLAEDLTVEENIFLGRELMRGPFLDKGRMAARADELLSELETPLDPRRRVAGLSVSQKQMVEIAKAVSRDARVLVMDEPTDVLTPSETRVLFRLIHRLKAGGVTVVFISHKLDEVMEIADRVTVLRDGRRITTQPVTELSEERMANLMVGRELSDMYPAKVPPATGAGVVFAAQDVTVPPYARGISFELHRGEVLGFFGLIGAGRTELFEGILGLRPRSGGKLAKDGRPLVVRRLHDAVKAGVVYLSEDRGGKGLITGMKLRPNLTLLALEKYARPFIDRKREFAALRNAIDAFDIRVPGLEAKASTLSGGNQQKLVLAKIMEVEPDVIVLDEPTRGIDVGTKRQFYFLIKELTEAGKSVILISSEMPEIIGLCHRVVVMRSGEVTGVLDGADLTEEEIVLYATGLKGAA